MTATYTAEAEEILTTLVNMYRREQGDAGFENAPRYSFFDDGVLDGGIWKDCMAGETGDPKVYGKVITRLVVAGVLTTTGYDSEEKDEYVYLSEDGRKLIQRRRNEALEAEEAESTEAAPVAEAPTKTWTLAEMADMALLFRSTTDTRADVEVKAETQASLIRDLLLVRGYHTVQLEVALAYGLPQTEWASIRAEALDMRS